MEQLEIVIKNNTRLTFHRYIQILEKGEWIYHPLEKIEPGVMISFVCSNASYQNILGCNVVYTSIVDGIEHCINYKYESRIMGDGEANVRVGIINKDDSFIEIPKSSNKDDHIKKLFYLDTTNGVQRSIRKLMTHVNIRETELGSDYLEKIDNSDNSNRYANYDFKKLNLNSNYYEWIERLRKYPRSLCIRIVNFSDCDLTLELPAAKKNDNEKFKQRNLATSTLSSAVTPSMHFENHSEKLLTRGPISPYSMSNMICGGQWVEFPPEKIKAYSVCEFGAGCESLFSTDFIGNVIYKVSGYAGKILFNWEFPAGMSPNLTSNGFHNLHNLTVSSHYENFNDGHLIFHILDEAKPFPIRILSVKAIFGDSFLNIFNDESNRKEDKNNKLGKSIKSDGFINNKDSSETPVENKNSTTKNKIGGRFGFLNNEVNRSPAFYVFGNQTRDISSFFFEYIKPKVVIGNNGKNIYLYDELCIDNPRVFFSFLLTNSNININPRYSADVGSFSLFIEWSIGCIVFKKIWSSDEKLFLNSKLIGGISEYSVLLSSTYPSSCRRNKSLTRVYPPVLTNSNSCENSCFMLNKTIDNSQGPFLLKNQHYSNPEIALIGQQLISYILAPYLVKYMKSKTISRTGGSSAISNSSRYSNTSTVFQGHVENDHIWNYSKVDLNYEVGVKENYDKHGILDFQGTVNFLIFHWDDLFFQLFEKKLSKVVSITNKNFNPDTILCILQRVSLLWENKDFELFEDPFFVREFIDVGIVICEIIQYNNNSNISSSLQKLRNLINFNEK
ncbi:hypothetical protein FG386_002117 [Cryptosporidium ryanae]|uniref:uncharacterized protein n=1 Tax=Cryptosporidium ryanae TaxID=515981 RepID=UPI00351A3A89|nr:hypothetical protein FG386_002117 [Cryptosporidium ryanae]